MTLYFLCTVSLRFQLTELIRTRTFFPPMQWSLTCMSAFQVKMFQGENLNDFLQHRGALEGQKKITSLKICTTNLQLRGPNFTAIDCTIYIIPTLCSPTWKSLDFIHTWCFLLLRLPSVWICKNKMSYDYKHLMGNLILTTSPWNILTWNTLVLTCILTWEWVIL